MHIKKITGKKFKVVFEIILFVIMILSMNTFSNIKRKKVEISKYNSQRYECLFNQAGAKELESTKSIKNVKYNDEAIPVLMYHSINGSKDKLFIESKKKFERDMEYLTDNKFNTITMDELYDFVINNKTLPKKSILITFDDGYVDNYTIAYPILKKFNLKATVFVVTNGVDKGGGYLNVNQMKEMLEHGIDIQSHTVAHEKLTELSYEDQFKTLKQSKDFLEEKLNKEVKYLAYPYGKYNIDTLKAATEAGYSMAFTTEGNWANKSNGVLTLNRVFISGRGSIKTLDNRVNNPHYKLQYWPF